jgi:hypothetical protein
MGQRPRAAAEERLDFFVGDWQDAGHAQAGSFGPGGATTGRTMYRWRVGGKWLLYTSHMDIPGMGSYVVHGGVAFNGQTGQYDAFAINNLGNLMAYEGTWTDQATLVFTLIHPPPGGRSRVIYRTLSDGSMRMRSEQRTDSGDFRAYFETEMTRL